MILNCNRHRVMLVLLAFGLAGCASRGNEVLKGQDPSTINLTIVDGQTTRDEVQKIYGAPGQTTFLSEKNEVWTYRWARATAQGQNFIPIVGAFVRGYDVRKKELVIVFNERNVVARHTMTDNNNSIKTGLIDKGPADPLSAGTVSAPTPPPLAKSPSSPSAPASKPVTASGSTGSPGAAAPADTVTGLSRSRL